MGSLKLNNAIKRDPYDAIVTRTLVSIDILPVMHSVLKICSDLCSSQRQRSRRCTKHTCADRRQLSHVFHLCSALIDLLLLLLKRIRFWTFAISRGGAALFRLRNPETITGVECEWVAWLTCWRTRDDLKLSFSSFGLVEALCVLVQDLQRCSDSTRTSSLSFLLPLRSVLCGCWRVSLLFLEIHWIRRLFLDLLPRGCRVRVWYDVYTRSSLGWVFGKFLFRESWFTRISHWNQLALCSNIVKLTLP
jgi:hypothetical protein